MRGEGVGPRRAAEVVGLVLAAGGSSRWGGQPKALLTVDGLSSVERLVRTLRAAEIERVGVVTGAPSDRIEQVVRAAGAEAIHHPGWRDGRTGSVQVGLRWAGPAATVVLAPVDHPFAQAITVRRLLEVARRDAMARWVQPSYGGRAGHPVVLLPEVQPAVLSLGPDQPLRVVPRGLGIARVNVPTDDPGALLGTDTPEELARSVDAWRRRSPEASWTGE